MAASMNSTPKFEEIAQTIPLESLWKVRLLAGLRLILVCCAIFTVVQNMTGSPVWSQVADRLTVFIALWVGFGIYGDSIEDIWKRLGILGRPAAYATAGIIALGTMLSDLAIWTTLTYVFVLAILLSMAFGLLMMAKAPMRAARFRQMVRYLRRQPKTARREIRAQLDRNFATLIAEGFE